MHLYLSYYMIPSTPKCKSFPFYLPIKIIQTVTFTLSNLNSTVLKIVGLLSFTVVNETNKNVSKNSIFKTK